MQEAAAPRGADAAVVAATAEEGVQVPAAVGGEAGDAVLAVGEHAPQVVGGLDAAGHPAGHADDDDGVVGDIGGHHRRAGLAVFVEEFGDQVFGEAVGGGVVEDEGGGEAQAGDGGEAVAQFDGGEGVEAQLAELAPGFHGPGRGVAQYGGGLGADQFDGVTDPVLGGQRQEAAGEVGRGARAAGGRGRGATRAADEVAQQRRDQAEDALVARRGADRYDQGLVGAGGGVEEG